MPKVLEVQKQKRDMDRERSILTFKFDTGTSSQIELDHQRHKWDYPRGNWSKIKRAYA